MKVKDFFANLFIFLLLSVIILCLAYLLVIPYDHYMVGGIVYGMSKWECLSEETADGEMGIWVSCSRLDGTEEFRKLSRTFSVVNSRFDN